MNNNSRFATGTTPEQSDAYRAASRQLHAAGFQIRLPAWKRDTERRLIARKLRAGRTTQLTLDLSWTAGTPISLTSWTFNTRDDTRYFALGRAELAVAAAIATAAESAR